MTQLISIPSRQFHNPFRGIVVGDPWNTSEDISDVPQIHENVFETCIAAIEEARCGDSSRGIVIHGSPGSGKTHLIGRLRRRLVDSDATPSLERLSQAFAYVRLNTHSSMLAQHALRCIASDLLRTRGPRPSQLERMVLSRLMEADGGEGDLKYWWEHFEEVRRDDLENLLGIIQSQEGLSPDFVRILGHLVRKQHRLDVANWLRGDSMTDESRARLGIGPVAEDIDLEEAARQRLIDFMRLAGKQVPLVICFDQIEAIQVAPDDINSFFQFGRLVAELSDADPNIVLISCLQTERYDLLKRAVASYAVPRLQGYASLVLNPLKLDEAIELVARRLETREIQESRPSGTPAVWPFTNEQIAELVGPQGTTPRRLLEGVAQKFSAISSNAIERPSDRPEETREQWLAGDWTSRLEESNRLTTSAREILTHAVPLLIRAVDPAWRVASTRQGVAIDHVLTAPENEGRVGVKICEGNPNSLARQLVTLAGLHPENTGLHRLVLLRDERVPINKTAKKTWEAINRLRANDANFHPVGPEVLAALDAMRLMLSDAQSGDLAFRGETVTEDLVLNWLRENMPSSMNELVESLTGPRAILEESFQDSIQSLQEWLRKTPVADWEEAKNALSFSGRSADDLLNRVRDRTDMFRVIEGNPTVVISARHGGAEPATQQELE